MRALAAADKTISPDEILRMATVNGAKPSAWPDKSASFRENAFADLIAIPFAGKRADIYEAVLASCVNRLRQHD